MADENLNNGGSTTTEGGADSGQPVSIPVKHEGEGEFVGKQEFNKFQTETSTALNTILGLLEKKEEPEAVFREKPKAEGVVATAISDAQALVEAAGADVGYMPPQYTRIFEKYFDPADGFEARLVFPDIDEQGRESGGIMFTINVPMKFSNAQEAYKTFYKVDIRSRALRPDGISKGIDDWCRRVARNLGYNKMLKTK